MSLGHDMLSEIEQGGSEHPLGMLGLSPEVLSLGLTEDELYSVCKRFARSLLAEVHEDRVERTARTKHLQVRFSRAMTALRDTDTFRKSLNELREQDSKLRQEASHFRRAHKQAMTRASDAEHELTSTVGKLGECRRFLRDMKEEATRARNRETTNVSLARNWALRKVRESYQGRVEGLNRSREVLRVSRARLWNRSARLRRREEQLRLVRIQMEKRVREQRQENRALTAQFEQHLAALGNTCAKWRAQDRYKTLRSGRQPVPGVG